jgi:hypothetical protein
MERRGGETGKKETASRDDGEGDRRLETKEANEDLEDMQQAIKQTGSMFAYILTAEIYSYIWQINVHSACSGRARTVTEH